MTDPRITEVNRALRALMTTRGVSTVHVAALLGISVQQVRGRLRGAVPWRLGELLAVADLVGATPAALVTPRKDHTP
jgi:hypothetical protein